MLVKRVGDGDRLESSDRVGGRDNVHYTGRSDSYPRKIYESVKFLRHPNGDNDGVPLQLASISYPSVTLIKMATKFEVSPNSSTSSLRTHISTLNTSIKCVLVNI